MSSSPPSEPVPKSARELCAANRSAGVLAVAPKPKSSSRKRQQSNADESVSKRNKTATKESDDGANDVEEANSGQKGGKKGKKAKKTGTKGKNMYLFYFLTSVPFNSLTTSSRKTWADRQQEDEIENVKGTPARLQPCVF